VFLPMVPFRVHPIRKDDRYRAAIIRIMCGNKQKASFLLTRPTPLSSMSIAIAGHVDAGILKKQRYEKELIN
jgi:hypothetical protein